MKNSKILLLVIALVIPLFCLVVILAGVLGYGLISATSASSPAPGGTGQNNEKIEAEVITIAAEYAASNDLEAAQTRLKELGMPNPGQYLSYMVDRYISEGSGPEDLEAANLLKLADALGATTPAMIAALSTPTPVPTPTLPPTSTPPPTNTPLPTDTPAATSTPIPPTAPPAPTDTAVPPTKTPGPPTNTPAPTNTPVPTQPPVDFVISEQRIFTMEENGGCRGGHQIFITVLDKAGNPLDKATVEDTFKAVPPKLTGEKGPGKVEYDLWKNGFSVTVTKNEDGSPATSQVTDKLSSVDTDIPTEWLLQGGYCADMGDCTTRKGTNQLCFGHYSYFVTFQKTH